MVDASAPLATITSQTPTVGPNNQGMMVPGFKVGFTTRNGLQGFEFVSADDIKSGKASSIIKPLAQALEANYNAPVA